ncbi:hypothetical protein ACXO4N_08105, partial [Lactobacillus delbrueckii subsp. bulgaricus]
FRLLIDLNRYEKRVASRNSFFGMYGNLVLNKTLNHVFGIQMRQQNSDVLICFWQPVIIEVHVFFRPRPPFFWHDQGIHRSRSPFSKQEVINQLFVIQVCQLSVIT